MISELKKELFSKANKEKARILAGFFKTKEGEYGHGDIFLGITVPELRALAKTYYKKIHQDDIILLLESPEHECRLIALYLLVYHYEKASTVDDKKKWTDLYLSQLAHVNNWDLVDSSAYQILGAFLYQTKDTSLLYTLAKSNNLWTQRVAIISTFYFIKKKRFDDTLKIATVLLNHKHDLIHKAVGWMIREVGKRDYQTAYHFVYQHHKSMPRTMLRYAIEKYDEPIRQLLLKGGVHTK